MQETRLNLLLSRFINQITGFFINPWRRFSLNIICLFLGFFLASAIAATVGQQTRLDITMALFFTAFVEGASILIYRNRDSNNPLWRSTLNSLKIGLIYGLALEALKLNS
ncbi:MAG: DUF565 domain-containing protein [Cyanobacterium sp. T60_A2020_053]|nr:DUF565 domain-containing protein [Cyanobacterium sp. T60_A2020_053]